MSRNHEDELQNCQSRDQIVGPTKKKRSCCGREVNGKIFVIISGVMALAAVVVLIVSLSWYFTRNDKESSEVTEPAMQTQTQSAPNAANPMDDIQTDCGYVEVRDKAHMFWLLYYQDDSFAPTFLSKLDPIPIVVWLQGGPGASSTGYGNFEELGPLNLDLSRRATSWTGLAHVLFIDNPVGTGYSYVETGGQYATNIDQVGLDLVALLKGFYQKTQLWDSPLYIFCESYGGKMASVAGREIVKEVNAGTFNIDFRGVGLGDSWISPIDSVNSWGEYLFQTSLLDIRGLTKVNEAAALVQQAINDGDWERATQLWTWTEIVVSQNTDNVDFYNILYPHHSSSTARRSKNATYYNVPRDIAPLFDRHVGTFATDPLDDLMNGDFKAYLTCVPDYVVWGAQSGEVFNQMRGDFMKPTIDIVDQNINDGIKVAVYNGMLDLIVDTPGQEHWLDKMSWGSLVQFEEKSWTPQYAKQGADTGGFVKSMDNFSFWWVINAGHMVPTDQGEFMLYLLHSVITNKV